MEDFLRKMKLVDDLSITLKVNKSHFIAAFRGNVDESDLDGVFSGAFDAFSSSKNLYRGEVNSQNFRIRKKRTFFNNYASLPIAKGRFIQREDNLVIETKINGVIATNTTIDRSNLKTSSSNYKYSKGY